MSEWKSAKAKRVLAALEKIGWQIKRQKGSHKTLSRLGWADYSWSMQCESVWHTAMSWQKRLSVIRSFIFRCCSARYWSITIYRFERTGTSRAPVSSNFDDLVFPYLFLGRCIRPGRLRIRTAELPVHGHHWRGFWQGVYADRS